MPQAKLKHLRKLRGNQFNFIELTIQHEVANSNFYQSWAGREVKANGNTADWG